MWQADYVIQHAQHICMLDFIASRIFLITNVEQGMANMERNLTTMNDIKIYSLITKNIPKALTFQTNGV